MVSFMTYCKQDGGAFGQSIHENSEIKIDAMVNLPLESGWMNLIAIVKKDSQ